MSKVAKKTSPIEVFGGGKGNTLGSTRLSFTSNGCNTVRRKFILSPVGHTILSFRDCLEFGLVKLLNSPNACNALDSLESRIEFLKNKYSDIFDDSKESTMRHTQAVVHLLYNTRPRYIRARLVPLALREKVASEIREMEKHGSVRVCADFTQTISPVVDKMLHPLLHPDELFTDLAQAQFFSKMDFAKGYKQYLLEQKSKKLLVINTQLGLDRYNVLPYCLASALTIVQVAQEKLLSGIGDLKIYIDDVLKFSKSKEEHFRILKEVFSRISNAGDL
nr:uncharacterized protein K02A2.6-like [Lepeophtheirus salmonis]